LPQSKYLALQPDEGKDVANCGLLVSSAIMEADGKARDVLLQQTLPNPITADDAFHKLIMFVAVYGGDWRKCIAIL
jgi:hypothetical protein